MKKPVKDYITKYPTDKSVKQYYGDCESCNKCNSNHVSCGLINK